MINYSYKPTLNAIFNVPECLLNINNYYYMEINTRLQIQNGICTANQAWVNLKYGSK